jgi:hypothetical protein
MYAHAAVLGTQGPARQGVTLASDRIRQRAKLRDRPADPSSVDAG